MPKPPNFAGSRTPDLGRASSDAYVVAIIDPTDVPGVAARVLLMRNRIAATTALTLVLGFAVASLSGSRALGGVVLVLGGALCAWWMTREFGALRAGVTLVAVFVLFVVSHPLGHVIGAWPSVLLVAAVAGGVAYALAADSWETFRSHPGS